MANLILPDSINAGTDIVAGEVQGMFDSVVSHSNNAVIHRDGGKTFTQLPTSDVVTNPTADGHLVTKKALENRTGVQAQRILVADSGFMAPSNTVETSSGYTLPTFTMPSLAGFSSLRIECYVPRFYVANSGGFPAPSTGMYLTLRDAFSAVWAYWEGPFTGTAFTSNGPGSAFIVGTILDNTLAAPGVAVNLTLKGRVDGTIGQFKLVSTATVPTTIIARMI